MPDGRGSATALGRAGRACCVDNGAGGGGNGRGSERARDLTFKGAHDGGRAGGCMPAASGLPDVAIRVRSGIFLGANKL